MLDDKLEKNSNKKNEFNILVIYDKEGISFQSVVERILLRKLEQI